MYGFLCNVVGRRGWWCCWCGGGVGGWGFGKGGGGGVWEVSPVVTASQKGKIRQQLLEGKLNRARSQSKGIGNRDHYFGKQTRS